MITMPKASGASRLLAVPFSLLTAACLLAGAAAHAEDRADIDRTQIIGNRELPKVLYIVPWKKPVPGDLTGKPAMSVLDEVLAPVDRDVFRRQAQYDAVFQPKPAKSDEGK